MPYWMVEYGFLQKKKNFFALVEQDSLWIRDSPCIQWQVSLVSL